MAGVGALCKAFMNGLCATRVEGAHIMYAALQRPPGQVLTHHLLQSASIF